MEESEVSHRLSRITTMWTMVFQANKPEGEELTSSARRVLLQRYSGAIYRYLLAALRDSDAADELSQEFALAFIRGDFKKVAPEKGRFRDYVKTVLFHLVNKYFKKKQKLPHVMGSELPEPAAHQSSTAEADREFLARWREELLARTWEALEKIQESTGHFYYTVLRFRAKNPGIQSAQMAEQLGSELGKNLTAAGIRQTLHRARDKFADLLLDEVACSLETNELSKLEQELIDLGLLSYCQDALKRRSGTE